MKVVALLCLALVAAVVNGENTNTGNLRNADSNNAVDSNSQGRRQLSSGLQTILSSLVPMFLPQVSGAFVSEVGSQMDSILIGDEEDFDLGGLGYVGACEVDASVNITIYNISGLSNIILTGIEENAAPTVSSADATKVQWSGNWDIHGSLTSVKAYIGAELTSSSCGLSIYETMEGTLEITNIDAEFNIDISGKSRYEGTHIVTDYEVKDITFDVDEATLNGQTYVSTSMGDVDISEAIKEVVDEELWGFIKTDFMAIINGLKGQFLPFYIYGYPFTASPTV